MTTQARLMPMVEGEIAVTLELVPADEAIRMLMVLGADDQQLSLELIVIGNTQYIRAVDPRRKREPLAGVENRRG